jgi:gliding motility-associated-like protein
MNHSSAFISFVISSFRINILWGILPLFFFMNFEAEGLSISETERIQKGTTCIPPLASQVPLANMQTRYLFNGNMNDASGTGNNGIPQIAPALTSDRFSVASAAYSFDGISQWMTSTTAYNSPNTFSIGLWFKTSSTNGGGLMGFCESQTTTGFTNRDRVIYMNNSGQLEFGVYPGSIVVIKTPESYNDGFWHFATATLSSNGMKLYVDGLLKLVNSSVTTGQSMTGYWRLGYFDLSTGWSTANSNYFNGVLDDVFFYDRELTPAEIKSIYEMPDGAGSDSPKCAGEILNLKGASISGASYSWTGPAGFTSSLQNPMINNISSANEGIYYLTITDSSGCPTARIPALVRVATVSIPLSQAPTAGLLIKYLFTGGSTNDLSGNANSAIPQNSPVPSSGRYGFPNNAYLLNGTNQYLSTTNSYSSPTVFTIMVWFKTTTTTGGRLIGFGSSQNGSSASSDRQIYMTDAGQLIFGVNNTTPNVVNSGGEVYNDGQWHCAVGTLSAAGLNLYVDGVLQGSDPSVTTAQNYTGYWRVGYDQIQSPWPSPPTSKYFNGNVDDVYIYNVVIPSSSIAQYNSVDGAGSNEPFCGAGGTLNLTAPTFGSAYSYNWTGPNGFVSVSQNPSFPGITTVNSGVYSLTVTTTSSCPARAFVNVRADNFPAAPSVTGSARCGPGTISISAGGSPLKYRWYTTSSGGVSLAGATSYNPNISSTTTFYVSSVNAAGCESLSRTSVTATMNAILPVPIIADISRCGPGTVTFNASGSPSDYKWYDASSGGTLLGTGSAFTTPLLNSTITYYTSSLSVENCESARVPVVATIIDFPIAPVGTYAAICGSGSMVLTATGSPSKYNWYSVSTGGSAISTGSTFTTPSLNSTTTYFVTSVNSANCESTTRTAVIATVNVLPPDPSGSNGQRCGTGIVAITASGSPFSYYWYTASSGGSSVGTGVSFTTPPISSTTTYYVSSLSDVNCESASRTAVVAAVNSLPPEPAGTNGEICGSGTTALSATGSQDYKWYSAPTGGLALGSGSNFNTPFITATTNYYVSSIDLNLCESAGRTTVIAHVNAVPAVPSATGDSICSSGTANLAAFGSVSGYKWYDALTGGNLLGSTATFSAFVSTDTVFYVSSEINGCESSRIQVHATVSVMSNAGNLSSSQTVCRGNNTGIISLNGFTGLIRKWEISNDGFVSDSTDPGNTSAQYQYNNLTQTKSYRVTVKSGNCPSVTSAVVSITVDPSPPSVAGLLRGDTLVAYGTNSGEVTLFSYTGNIIRWEISTDNFSTFSQFNISTSNYPFENYTVTTYIRAVVQSGVCAEKISNFVTVVVDPPLVLVADTVTTTMNKNYKSGISVISNDQIGHFNQLKPIISQTTAMGGTVTLDNAGNFTYSPPAEFIGIDHIFYSVCDKATGLTCKTTDLVFVIKDTVIVYSSLTPNGDGINDSWVIDGINLYKNNKVKIINRWGDLVFEESNYDNKEKVWKGECNSGFAITEKNLPDGTYFYSIDLSNGSKPITGYVVIKQ